MRTLFSEQFSALNKPGFFIKAEGDNEVQWFIGCDDDGNKCIKYRGTFKTVSVDSTRLVSVKQYSKEVKTITFSLLDNSYCFQFYTFCEDLIRTTTCIKEEQKRYDLIVSLYAKWKKMFQNTKSDILAEEHIRGLIAEIMFLINYMFHRYDQHDALLSWSGQELTHKDFSMGDIWFEIKSVLKGKDSVRISSLEQLDSNVDGFLVVYYFEKMSAMANGVDLNTLVRAVHESIESESDKEIFIEKVSLQGFHFDERYEDYKYIVSEPNYYLVNGEFPRLTQGIVGPSIVKAEYSLSINGIASFRRETL